MGKIPAGRWETLSPELKKSLQARLASILELLARAATPERDGPIDKASFMHYAYASNNAIKGLMGAAIILTVVVLAVICMRWEKSTKLSSRASSLASSSSMSQSMPASSAAPAEGISASASPSQKSPIPALPPATSPTPNITAPETSAGDCPSAACSAGELDVLIMVMLMGALGALLRLIGSLGKFIGNRQLLRSWISYYMLMPLEGAALAPIFYLVLRVGVLAPPSANNAVDLNVFGVYAIAGLTGLFAKQAMEMLKDVFAVIFKRVEAKDALDLDKKKQVPAESAETASERRTT
jgi:hypothetical protein